MWLAVFYIWGSLLAFSVCHICSETSEDAASWVTLKPLGHCGDEENLCPYQLTLPPLSIQLPRPFRELEKMAKELQNLKDMVNQLRRDCQERKDRHSIESGGQKEHSEEKERRHQSPRHNISISIKETQSHSGEQVFRLLTSTLPQGDTSESEGTVKDGVKRLNHSVLESQEWNIDPRIVLNEGTTDQSSEMRREVKIFNPSLDERPEDISKVKLVLSPTPEETEKEMKSKQSELIEPSLPRKKDTIQSSTHGKQQLNILRDGHVKNISGFLAARRRVQNVPDANGLSSISRDANTRIMDLSTSAGNRRVVKFPREGGPMRPKGSYINSRVVQVNNEDRLKNPALVRIHNPQAKDMMFKIEPEEAGFSPARSGIMRVKETSPLIANTKTGVITGPNLSTDDQNNQDISRVSGPRTDGLKDASQVTKMTNDNLRKVNKTGITRLPTNLRKENQGDVSHITTNKSISSVMNQAEQPNMVKEEKQYVGQSESLVVNSSEEETRSNLNIEDLTFPGRQVENEKYLNPITETNNRQTDLKMLDKADSTFNERRVLVGKTNPQARDMMVKTGPEEAGFSPARSGIMLVKETSPHIANKKPGPISGPTLSTDDQNKQDISRDSGPRTDDGHGLKYASQATNVREDNLRKVNKTGITRLPTNLRKENQGDVSHTATNKSISSVMKQGIVPNMFKEEKQYVGLSESLVVISSEAEISSNVDIEDLTFLGRQVENEKYLNPITKTNNRKIDSTILDKADSTFNERTLPPDLKDQMQPGMFSEGANEHIGFNSLSAGTMKKDIPIHSKAILPEKDLVKPTLVPTVKSKSTESTVSTTSRVQSLVVGQGTRRISITPLKAAAVEGPSQNSKKNISKIREVSQDNKRYVMPNPDRHPIRHPTTVISSKVNNLRQSNVMGNMSANRSVGVHSKLSIPVRNSNTARKNGYGIIRPSYIRKLNFQSQPNRTRGFKTKANTVTQFSSPTGATEQVQTEEIKHIPQVMRSNVLDNKWLKNNSTESKSQQSQNSGDVQGLEKVQQRKNQVRDNSEPVLITNIGSAEDPNTLQSGASNSPTGGKESKIFSLGTDDTSNQHPFEVDKISSGKKGPTAPTLKKELSKEPGTTLFTTSTVSFMDTDHEDSTKNILKTTKTHVEIVKNISWETPISFENTGTTRELELIQFNKDRVEENSGEILSNPNSADIAQGYSGERYTIPVVLETLTNVEEIKGSKLFSLGPEDAAEGFKSHAVSDEVTEREQVENKIHSICDSDCNTTSTQQSTTLTRGPVDSGREKGRAQDCADYITKSRRNGVYRVMPQPKSSMLPVFCDMESSGGGWTLIQHRFDGSTSFNRTWDEYKNGFGKLIGEFWLGNDKIHLLTKAKNMSLRIEIEDFEGIREYAHYDHFYVANESQQYCLSISGYSGTAGNAMQFSKKYNHDQKLFTTPDRDNDQYPSGNCGAYYSSGWWFDACMSANLNGRYYQSKYKGVRNGIFWGTWHNITMEYYPTNDRQSFKTVKMMIRPKNYAI